MILFQQKFDSFSAVNYVINSLNEAIGTTYLPSGETVTEVINNFTKIQSSRSFCPSGCYTQAGLSLYYNEDALNIYYSSSSSTAVEITYNFANNMEVENIDLNVVLPNDRAIPGRCHWETITKALYNHDWLNVDYDNETVEIMIPWELVRLNQDVDFSNLIPSWVKEEHSNYTANFNPDKVDNELASLGYETKTIPGFKKSWYNSKLSQYIVFHTRLHPIDNNYYILKEGKNFDFSYGLSYNRLIERITVSSLSDDDTLIEEYEYDENEYANDDED
jgi:hypothetical protein